MMPLTLAFRNIFRQKARTLITLMTVGMGCVALILAGGFIQDTIVQVREAYIQDILGHLRIYPKHFAQKGLAHPFDHLITQPGPLLQALDKLPHVRSASPRLSFSGLASTGETTLSFIGEGVDPQREGHMKEHLTFREGQFFSAKDGFEVLLGKGLADALALHPGMPLVLVTNTIRGAMNASDVSVQGVFGTADKAFDDRAIRMPLALAQRLLRTESVQMILVLLDHTSETHAVQSAVEKMLKAQGLDYDVQAWDTLPEADYILKVIAFYSRIFLVLQIIIVIVVTLSVANTMNMAVLERIGEIGTLMALGTRQKGIVQLFMMEGVMMGVLGGGLGCLIGVVLAYGISLIGIPMPSPPGTTIIWTARIAIVPGTIALAFAMAIATAVISALLPAIKASRLDTAEALRHNI